MSKKLILGNETTGEVTSNNNRNLMAVHTAAYTGVITELNYYGIGADIKPNFYNADGSGVPTTKIWSNDSGVTLPSGWGVVSITPSACIAGVQYAIGVFPEVDDGIANKIFDGSFNRYYSPITTYGSFSAPGTISGYSNDATYQICAVARGYTPPVITSVNSGKTIRPGYNVSLVGTDLLDSAGDPEVWICSSATYSTALVKTKQDVKSVSDTAIDFEVVKGALQNGTAYVFVTTGLDQQNATGTPITLIGSPSKKNRSKRRMPLNIRTVNQAGVATAIDWDIACTENGILDRIAFKFDSAPTTNEDITITLDSADGVAYDHVLAAADPEGETSYVFELGNVVKFGDVVTVTYTNTDANTVSAIAYIEQ